MNKLYIVTLSGLGLLFSSSVFAHNDYLHDHVHLIADKPSAIPVLALVLVSLAVFGYRYYIKKR